MGQKSDEKSGPATGGRRVWAFRAGLVLGVLVLAEGALQVGFHLVPRFGARLLPEWDERGRQVLPDAKLVWVGNPYWPEHDAWGFRNRRVPRRAAIVAVGDSQTYGTAAGPDMTWPAQLERRVGRKVYNMSMGGYCAVQALELSDRALSLQPDTIIFAFYSGNDLYDAFTAVYEHRACPELRDPWLAVKFARLQAERPIVDLIQSAHGLEPAAPRPGSVAAAPGALRRWVSRQVMLYALARSVRSALAGTPGRAMAVQARSDEADWPIAKADALAMPEHRLVYERDGLRTIFTPGYRFVPQDLEDPRMAEGLRLSTEAILRMRARCAERSVAFHVMLIPTKELVFAPLVDAEEGRASGYERLIQAETRVRHDLRASLLAAGVPIIDVLPALRGHTLAGEKLYPASENGHPLASGYEVIADAVAAGLAGHQAPSP